MYKLIAFVTFAEHLPRAQARAYYEERHAPLIRSLIPEMLRYRRNHLVERTGGVDVVTEMWFADCATADRAIAHAQADPDTARCIAEDEARFMNRTATRLVAAEEAG